MTREQAVEMAHKAICAEECAHYGEPPCHEFRDLPWPNPNCDEPGCKWLAAAAITALSSAGVLKLEE